MNATTALVTGATGFIGSHLVRRLVHDGFAVHVLCRERSSFWRLEDAVPRIVRHQVPLEDAPWLGEVVALIRPDYVFHLASATVVAVLRPPRTTWLAETCLERSTCSGPVSRWNTVGW